MSRRAWVLWVGLAVGCGGSDDKEMSGATDTGSPHGGSGDDGGSGGGGSGDDGGDSSDSGDTAEPDDCDTIATFADGITPTTELHVAPDGSDGGTGTSDDPLTFAAALRAATPGTAVRVHAGTYDGGLYFDGLQGSASAPIWVGGVEGEATPVLSGANTGLQLSRAKYVVLHDLEVTGANYNGINLDDGGDYADAAATHHVVVRDVRIHNIGGDGNQDCLKLSGLRDFHVLDSSFSRCGGDLSGSGVDMVGCHAGTVARSHFFDLSANGVQAKGGTADIRIARNIFENTGDRGINMGGSTSFEYFRPPLSTDSENAEAWRLQVESNLFIGSTAAVAYVGCVECSVEHNTIVDPVRWIARILRETSSDDTYTFAPPRDGVFANNIVVFDRTTMSSSEDINIGGGTEPETFVFENNLWYAHNDPSTSTPSLPTTETGGVVGDDPLLQADYTLDASSPAIGAGRSGTGVVAAHDGRCFGDPPAIGMHAAP